MNVHGRFMDGYVSKGEFAMTLCAHNDSMDGVKSSQRDKAEKYLGTGLAGSW